MRDPNERPSTADLAYGRSQKTEEMSPESEMRTDQATETRMDPVAGNGQMPLLSEDRSRQYADRWQDVQAEFVDEPQKAVEDADGLVAEVIQTLATSFAEQRRSLEDQWSQGTEVSTEDLRQALMQYRSFFQRLLAA